MTEMEQAYKRLYDKRWRKKNREYLNAKARERYAANREKIKAKRRAYYAANRERILARRRESYRQKKEALRDERL